MKYLLGLVSVVLLFSCRTNVLDEEKSFRVDNGQFSFSASKEKFQLADFRVDDEVVSVVSSIEDSLVLVDEKGEEKELNWRPFKPLHDKFTLIYNQSVDEPNLKFTRSIYVDQKKSQVKIRYNLKNRSENKFRYVWRMKFLHTEAIEGKLKSGSVEFKTPSAVLTVNTNDKTLRISRGKGDTEMEFMGLWGSSSASIEPLNRISWQVTLDIKSLEKKSWCDWF